LALLFQINHEWTLMNMNPVHSSEGMILPTNHPPPPGYGAAGTNRRERNSGTKITKPLSGV
jgi:hypothetical protein